MGLFSKSNGEMVEGNNITCSGVMDISRAAKFHQEVKAALGKGGVIVLDAAEIERIDTTILQLLLGLCRDAAARKVQVKWLAPSDALIRAAALLGLSKPLGLPEGN